MQTEYEVSPADRGGSERWRAGVAGALAGAAGLAGGELAAGLLTSLPSLVSGVATFVIDSVPPPVKDLAIAVFGTADKLALGVGIWVLTFVIGGFAGSRWSERSGLIGLLFALFALAGALAAARTPQVALGPALLNGVVSAGTAWVVFRLLSGAAQRESDTDRRRFLAGAAAVALLVVVGATTGRLLIDRTRRMLAGRSEVELPLPAEPVPAPAPAASFAVEGLSPVVTPNDTFYRIDTAAFSVPQVDLATWQLTLKGMVDREVSFRFEELLEMPMVERYITLACVSNRVGGDLVGNARWLGIPLAELLNRAGVAPGADQVVGRSVDGFTVGFPIGAVYDGRDALVAVGMNGEPLPFEHGFPARLVVAGLYGYVSATKWLSEIELTTWDGFDAYWVPRGWAKEAPIKTQSRIDTPRDAGAVASGRVPVAGVAWAPTRGISLVEVSIDEGEWRPAELAEGLSEDAWRQWRFEWAAEPGSHSIRVRATDGTGETQTAEINPPAPDGATGYHTIQVEVV